MVFPLSKRDATRVEGPDRQAGVVLVLLLGDKKGDFSGMVDQANLPHGFAGGKTAAGGAQVENDAQDT